MTWWRFLGVVGLGLALAGCAAGGGWAAAALFAMSVGVLALGGCTSSHTGRDDGGASGDDAGGSWSACCESGLITSCYCPPGGICNYAFFEDCGDGTCSFGVDSCPDAGVDAGVDAGGNWEPCCVDGRVTTCFCESGWECNFGWYNDCGDGTCVDPTATCGAVDGGARDAGVSDGGAAPDAGGSWDPCCVDGRIDSCFCPPDAVCNYWFTDCGAGACVFPGEMCPP